MEENGPRSDGHEGVLRICQSICAVCPSYCFVSYPGHSLVESCPSTEMQSVYSTVSAAWAQYELDRYTWYHITMNYLYQEELLEDLIVY